MASKKSYLKEKNLPVVILFVIWCLSLYATFVAGSGSFWADLQGNYKLLEKKNGIVVTMMPVLILVVSGLVSSHVKACLVFWRVKDPLPGHRAFTKLAPRDARIDMRDLRSKLGTVPRSSKEQNTCWYKIYKRFEALPLVENPHRSFLLARDLAAISIIFSIGGALGMLAVGVNTKHVALYFGLMICHYLLLALVARNHGNRLVCNVIVEYLGCD